MSVLLLLLAPLLLVAGGLAIDGGRVLTARGRAFDEAEQAARAGAQAVDIGWLRATGRVRVAPRAAALAVRRYLAETGDTGTIAVEGARVTVVVRTRQRTTLLSAVGITQFVVTGRATARPVGG